MTLVKEVKAFSKAQISAFVGGMVDFATMLFCTEVLGWHYTIGIVSGGIIGAIVNYTGNRYWSFQGRHIAVDKQIGKFVLVVIGSICLKSIGTTLLTELGHIDYRISRLITDGIVSLGFNYLLQRFWVFNNQMTKAN